MGVERRGPEPPAYYYFRSAIFQKFEKLPFSTDFGILWGSKLLLEIVAGHTVLTMGTSPNGPNFKIENQLRGSKVIRGYPRQPKVWSSCSKIRRGVTPAPGAKIFPGFCRGRSTLKTPSDRLPIFPGVCPTGAPEVGQKRKNRVFRLLTLAIFGGTPTEWISIKTLFCTLWGIPSRTKFLNRKSCSPFAQTASPKGGTPQIFENFEKFAKIWGYAPGTWGRNAP
jgi:hypothetical protein